MAEIQKEDVQKILSEYRDPETGRDVMQMEQVQTINVDGNNVSVTLGLASHSAVLKSDVRDEVAERIRTGVSGVGNVEVTITDHDRPASAIGQIGLRAKSVIAVGSGKGGVGKSTVATAIACGLHKAGSRVGLMDADVYGPSVPHLLGVSGRPHITEEKKIEPADCDGLKVMSMGLMVPDDEPIVWRGPMLHGAITQFLRDTDWGDLDYLIIDMPPGTGDIALTLSQLLPLTGAVVVCTPQDVALLDAVKAIGMFRKVNIPVLGMVENMSGFVCDCGKQYDIFGKGGARDRAEALDVAMLGEIPINISIRTHGDDGGMMKLFDDEQAESLRQVSYQLVKSLAQSNAVKPPMPDLPVL